MTVRPSLQTPPLPPSVGPFSLRQEEILGGLQLRILRSGFRRLRLSSVTRELNTSFATLYQMAPSRDELVAVVIERWYQRSIAHYSQQLQRTDDPVEALQLWTDAGVASVAVTSGEFWRDARAHLAIRRIIEQYSGYYVDVLCQIVQWGITTEVFRNVDTVVLAAVWQNVLTQLTDDVHVLSAEQWTVGDLSRNWVELITHGIVLAGRERELRSGP